MQERPSLGSIGYSLADLLLARLQYSFTRFLWFQNGTLRRREESHELVSRRKLCCLGSQQDLLATQVSVSFVLCAISRPSGHQTQNYRFREACEIQIELFRWPEPCYCYGSWEAYCPDRSHQHDWLLLCCRSPLKPTHHLADYTFARTWPTCP